MTNATDYCKTGCQMAIDTRGSVRCRDAGCTYGQRPSKPITTISGAYVDFLQACEVEAAAWRAVAEALDRNPDHHMVWEAADARDRAVIATNTARDAWEAERSAGKDGGDLALERPRAKEIGTPAGLVEAVKELVAPAAGRGPEYRGHWVSRERIDRLAALLKGQATRESKP